MGVGGVGGVGEGHRDVACGDCVAFLHRFVGHLFKILVHPPKKNCELVEEQFSLRYSREGFIVGCLLRITFVPLVFPAFVLSLRSTVLHRDRPRLRSSCIPALFDRVAVAKLLRHCLTHRLVGVPGQ